MPEIEGIQHRDMGAAMRWLRTRASVVGLDSRLLDPAYAAESGVDSDGSRTVVRVQGVLHPIWGVDAGEIVRELDSVNATDILVLIDSPGGSLTEMRTIYGDLMRRRSVGARVETEVAGTAYSAAAMIMLAGETRTVRETVSSVMVHGAWTVAVLMGNLQEIQTQYADVHSSMAHHHQLFAEMLQSATGADRSTVDGWLERDTFFSCSECVEAGIATRAVPALAEDDDAATASFAAQIAASSIARHLRIARVGDGNQ